MKIHILESEYQRIWVTTQKNAFFFQYNLGRSSQIKVYLLKKFRAAPNEVDRPRGPLAGFQKAGT
jgi:hypothetical protein